MDALAPQIAAALIDIGAVSFTPQAPITFKSGLLSPIYADNRKVPFHPQAWRLVIDGFQRLMHSLSFNPDLIAGIETAGIPHGAALAYQMGKPFVFVRKQAKDHGAKKRVEGGDVEGKRVLLIEDHISTGGSSLAGVDALRQDGARMEHCFAISSYGFPEAAQQFGGAHVQLHTLVTLPTILDSARQKGRFGESEFAVFTGLDQRPAWVGRATGVCEMNVIDNYNARVDAANSLVCVGLDSDHRRLPERFAGSATPQFDFNRWVIDQTHEFASAYKPNIAFYEARGDTGLRDLKATIDYLHANHPDILTICDAKRADIGSTNEGYVEAIFDWLGFDAVTLHPYLGREALAPFLERADKGCIILCRTSSPGAGEFQDALIGGRPLWSIVAQTVCEQWNQHGNCMLVTGATYPEELKRVREIVGDMTLLVPGIGAQGGEVERTVLAGLNSQRKGLIISSSRGIIFAENPGEEARKLRDQINQKR